MVKIARKKVRIMERIVTDRSPHASVFTRRTLLIFKSYK